MQLLAAPLRLRTPPLPAATARASRSERALTELSHFFDVVSRSLQHNVNYNRLGDVRNEFRPGLSDGHYSSSAPKVHSYIARTDSRRPASSVHWRVFTNVAYEASENKQEKHCLFCRKPVQFPVAKRRKYAYGFAVSCIPSLMLKVSAKFGLHVDNREVI